MEGRKNDNGKLRYDLIPFSALEEIVKVLNYGADKYKPNNWKHVKNFRARYFAAIMRHLVAWFGGEKTDPESGISHLAHGACSILFLIWGEKRRN